MILWQINLRLSKLWTLWLVITHGNFEEVEVAFLWFSPDGFALAFQRKTLTHGCMHTHEHTYASSLVVWLTCCTVWPWFCLCSGPLASTRRGLTASSSTTRKNCSHFYSTDFMKTSTGNNDKEQSWYCLYLFHVQCTSYFAYKIVL